MSFKFALNFDRTTHGLDRARELGDDAVAGATEHPAMMARRVLSVRTVASSSASMSRL